MGVYNIPKPPALPSDANIHGNSTKKRNPCGRRGVFIANVMSVLVPGKQ